MFKKSKNSELVAVASRNKDKAAKFAKKNKIKKFYDSYKKICEDKDIDVIYNPLPNHLHVNSTVNAIKNDKHVLLEKPISSNIQKAKKIISSSRKNKTHLLIGYHRRHNSISTKVKNKINYFSIGR